MFHVNFTQAAQTNGTRADSEWASSGLCTSCHKLFTRVSRLLQARKRQSWPSSLACLPLAPSSLACLPLASSSYNNTGPCPLLSERTVQRPEPASYRFQVHPVTYHRAAVSLTYVVLSLLSTWLNGTILFPFLLAGYRTFSCVSLVFQMNIPFSFSGI